MTTVVYLPAQTEVKLHRQIQILEDTFGILLLKTHPADHLGTHVHPWRIHVNVWQNQYSIVKQNKVKIKIEKKKKTYPADHLEREEVNEPQI